MTTRLAGGDSILSWSMKRTKLNHREYKLKILVLSDDKLDGPNTVLYSTPGLPLPGSSWNFGNDFDFYARCSPETSIELFKTEEPFKEWELEYIFTTEPINQCLDYFRDDPLLEPQKITGGFSRYTEEAAYDRYGQPLLSSSFEQLRGPQVEFDANRPTIKIEQNVANLEWELLVGMIDHVNDDVLWGLSRRKIKLSNISWERVFYGPDCDCYYRRTLEFDINDRTFDRDVADEGTKALSGHYSSVTGNYVINKIGGVQADYRNPSHFDSYVDRKGNTSRVQLDGFGLPANVIVNVTGTGTGTFSTYFGTIRVEKYEEANFLLLGIPTDFSCEA